MARKSKRMMQTDAIRQGQAKIAEGLKTGQMRGDNPAAQVDTKNNRLDFEGVAPGRTSFLTGKTGSSISEVLTLKTKLILLSCIGVLIVIIGLTAILRDSASTIPPVDVRTSGPQDEFSAPVADEVVPQRQVPPEKPSPPTATETTAPPVVVSTGSNAIVIYTIELDRKDILRPVAEFYHSKGIETEVITVSGKAALVTKAAFEQNPASRGTEGYVLLQRIKQLGPVYVEETQDTKFGVKPFQDAYGYKR